MEGTNLLLVDPSVKKQRPLAEIMELAGNSGAYRPLSRLVMCVEQGWRSETKGSDQP
jgi:hypothetical protein